MTGEFVTISRELWETAVKGLDSGDADARRTAFHRMLAAGPPSWDVDLGDPPDGPPTVSPYAHHIGRAVAAFDATLDALQVAGLRDGDPDRAEDLADMVRAELEAARRSRPPE